MQKTRRLCFLAVFTAMGLVLPSFFHMFGGTSAGVMFLPMHIPVLLTVFMLGLGEGIIMAIFLPCVSFLLTGMPPLAILPLMVIELSFYSIAAGILQKFIKSVQIRLIIALIAGRAAYGAVLGILIFAPFISAPLPISVLTSLLTSLPGIIIQLTLLPPLINITNRLGYSKNGFASFKKVHSAR